MEIKQMARSQLEQLWEDSWGESLPSGRPTPAKMDTYYPITNFNVALKEGKPIAYRGYGKKNGYTFIGMAYTKPEYLKQGIYSKLEPPTSGKIIMGLSQRNPDFSQSDWTSYQEGRGFTIDPSDEELDEIFGEDRDKSITDPFVNFYRNHDRNTWAVKNDSVAKWIGVLKMGVRNSWKCILKTEFHPIYDNLVFGILHDWVETDETDQEVYDRMTSEEKLRFHKDMINYTVKFPIFRREHLFHQRMSGRIRKDNRQTFPTIEEYEKKGVKFDRIMYKPKHKGKESLIAGYFQMWNNKYGREPSLTEIKEEEGRPLTVEEIESYRELKGKLKWKK